MFKHEYENQIDSIRPDGYVKQKVLNKITEKNSEQKFPKVKIIRMVAAVAACFAVLVSAVMVKDSFTENNIPVAAQKKNYDDIYKTVERFIPKFSFTDSLGKIFNGGSKVATDDIEIYYEYATDVDGAVATEGSAAGGSQKPNNNSSNKGTATKDYADIKSESESSENKDYSQTTTQVKNVDEADIIKTDGKYIYTYSRTNGEIRVVKAGKNPELLEKVKINSIGDMYLSSGKLVIIGDTVYGSSKATAVAYIYKISNEGKLNLEFECSQSGSYNTSRVIGDKLYLISNYYPNMNNVNKNDLETYIPYVESENYNDVIAAEDIYVCKNINNVSYTVICGFDVKTGSLLGSQSILGEAYTLYCSTESIIIADYENNGKTNVARFAISDGKVEFKSDGEIDGTLLNQFSIDEYKGYFRFVTTVNSGTETKNGNVVKYVMQNSNSLIVLDGDLKKVSSIDNIAPDERVYSVRFMGDIAYFVTFRNVDPLFSVDLSNPKEPKIIGQLKIPGFSNYLFPYGEGKLFGIGQNANERTGQTTGLKLSMFNTLNPSDVTEESKYLVDTKHSPSYYDHKETIVDVNKNMIGFSVWGKNGSEYMVFSYENGQFILKANIKLSTVYDSTRGLYIGNEFYLITDKTLYVYDMQSFNEIARLDFLERY